MKHSQMRREAYTGSGSRASIAAVCALAAAFGAACASPLFAASGSTSANFLKTDVGGRAASLAGSQFGAEKDGFAQFYNPAFLSNVGQREIGFMHNQFFQDIRQELLTYSHPTQSRGTFAGAFNYVGYGKIAGYDATGAATGDLSASDLMFNFGWGKRWSSNSSDSPLQNLATGAGLKVLQKKLHNKSAMGFAADLGVSYVMQARWVRGTRVAMSIQNLGPGLKFDTESSPLPRTIRAGLAYSFWGEALNLSLDGVVPSGAKPYASLSVEYRLLKMIALRAGYKGDPNLDKNFTYGVGFENPLFRVDYAFIPFGDLGDTHRISVLFRFGKSYKHTKADSQLQEKLKEAQSLYAQGQLIEAYMIAFQIQQIAPWHSDNNKFIGTIQKGFKEMESSYKKAEIQMQVDSILARGEKFFEEGNLINARLEFQAVLGLQPDHKVAQSYLKQIAGQFQSFVESFYKNGMIAFAAGNFQKAKEEFEKVLVIKPDHAEAKAQLNRAIQILEDQQKEADFAQQKDEISKRYAEALEAYRAGKHEEAITLFREVLKMNPENKEVQRYMSLSREILFREHFDKGQKFASRGEWEQAIKSINLALNFIPDSPEARNLLSDAQRRWELQKKVLSQNLYKEGLEAFLSGDKKKARSLWQRAVDYDPDNEEARRGLSRIAP